MENEHQTMFSQQIAHMTRGQLDANLTEELTNLVRAIMDTHKGGELTLKLKLKPEIHAHEVTHIAMTPEISTKLPSEKQMPGLFYPTHDGDLHREDPRQTKIPGIQEVEKPNQAPVDIPDDNQSTGVDI